MDVLGHNRDAWNGYVFAGNRWTVLGDLRGRRVLPCFLATRTVK